MTVKIEFKRKNLIIALGIVLLVAGFFFFYWSSKTNWDYRTNYGGTVDLSDTTAGWRTYTFGTTNITLCDDNLKPYTILLYPDDTLSMSFVQTNVTKNEQWYFILWEGLGYSNEKVVAYSDASNWLSFRNDGIYDAFVEPYFGFSNRANGTFTYSISVDHYETPHWFWFGLGIGATSSGFVLAIISTRQHQEKP
jgi:hypothetical protein